MSRPLKNIIANYGSRTWGLVSVYVFTPIYAEVLGVEYYAVIALYTVLFGIVTLVDAGMASAIDREFAKNNDNAYKLGLLFFFEKIYFSACFLAGFILVFFAEKIAAQWLSSNSIPLDVLTGYLRLIGIGVAIQLMPTIHFGALMGLQEQVKAGVLQFLAHLIKSTGGVALLLWVKPDLQLYFGWMIFCNIILVFISGRIVRNCFPRNLLSQRMSIQTVPHAIWKYIGGMFVITILSALSVQIDKVIAARLFSLTDLGYFVLAGILPQIPYIVTVPVVLAVFPHMTRTISDGREKDLYPVYRRFSFLISCIIFPVCIGLIHYGGDLFLLWQQKNIPDEYMRKITVLIQLLAISYTFFALQQLHFYFLLAKGRVQYTMIQSGVQVLLLVPLFYCFISMYGFTGAGFPLLIVYGAGFLYLYIIVFYVFIKSKIKNHLITTLLFPLIITWIIAWILQVVQQAIMIPVIPACILLGLISFGVNVLVFNSGHPHDKFNLKKLF